MKAKDKIIKAKVHLQKDNPFFAYLVMGLEFKEDNSFKSMGVNGKGSCVYNSKWVETLDDGELKGVLAHEVLHLALQHLTRGEDLNHEIFNISADLVINNILGVNDFELPNGLIPYRNQFDLGNGVVVEDLHEKTAEMVYHELLKNEDFKERVKQNDDKRFDIHEQSEGDDKSKQAQETNEKWKKALGEASVYARQKGNLPNGMERIIDDILNEKVNWKHLLYKYMTRTLPYDYTYSRPSKKSFGSGFYMPSILRENVEVCVSIDTSGSLNSEELGEFLGEITTLARTFNNITINLIVCDSEIHEVYQLGNNDSDLIKKLNISGGGGTDHNPVYDYIQKELPNTKLLVNFTDGYTCFPKYESVKSVWVLTKGSCKDSDIPFGEIIRL